MFECNDCGKTYPTSRGLAVHKSKCNAGDPRIAKLEKQIAEVRDAEAKHQLEQMLKDIKNR